MPPARPSCLHPAALLLLWAAYALALEFLSWPALLIAIAALLPTLLYAPARGRLMQLLRRSRWFFLVLPLAYAISIPGQPLWPGISLLSWPGIEAGVLRSARLLLMLAGLAGVLTLLVPAKLIYGLYVLARPFTHFGLDARALAVRLSLVLEGAQQVSPTKPWKLALRNLEELPVHFPGQVWLHPQPWSWRDGATLILAAGLLGALLG